MADPPVIDKEGTGERVSSAHSFKSAGSKAIPSPINSAKDNPAADLRSMRQIIAEDPEWSLATVPLLTELCIRHVVDNFQGKFVFNL